MRIRTQCSFPFAVGEVAALGIRPERLKIRAESAGTEGNNNVRGTVEAISYAGNLVRTTIRGGGGTRLTGECRPDEATCHVGDTVVVSWSGDTSVLLRE